MIGAGGERVAAVFAVVRDNIDVVRPFRRASLARGASGAVGHTGLPEFILMVSILWQYLALGHTTDPKTISLPMRPITGTSLTIPVCIKISSRRHTSTSLSISHSQKDNARVGKCLLFPIRRHLEGSADFKLQLFTDGLAASDMFNG